MLFEKYCQPRSAGITLSERFFTLSDFFLCGLRFATFFHEDWHHDGCHFPTSARTFFKQKIKQLENKVKSRYQIIPYQKTYTGKILERKCNIEYDS